LLLRPVFTRTKTIFLNSENRLNMLFSAFSKIKNISFEKKGLRKKELLSNKILTLFF